MLRIAPKDFKPKASTPTEKPMAEEEVLEPEEVEDAEEDPDEGSAMPTKLAMLTKPKEKMDDELASYPENQLSQLIVHYKPPTLGPFRCDHCMNWVGEGQCRFVEGEIAPDGLCNIYEPLAELEEVPDALGKAINVPKVNSQEMVSEPLEDEGEEEV